MSNGRIPQSSLGALSDSSERILSALVPQTEALRAAFKAHFGKTLQITDGYRPIDQQERIFRDRYTTAYLPGRPYRVWNGVRWYQRPGTAVAAVPGTSNHGWGQAIDFGSGVNTSLTSPEYKWMRANAPAYGWTHPLWAQQSSTREPWHWEASATPVNNYPGAVTGSVPNIPSVTPPNPIVEEDIVVSRAENQEDMANAVKPVLDGVKSLLARGYVYKLDVPGSQAIYAEVGTSARLWLKTAADVQALAPRATIPLPADDEFWARTVVYSVGELYRKKGDPSGAAYVLAGGVINGQRVPTIRHVSAAEYAGMQKPLLVDVAADAGLWRLPVI